MEPIKLKVTGVIPTAQGGLIKLALLGASVPVLAAQVSKQRGTATIELFLGAPPQGVNVGDEWTLTPEQTGVDSAPAKATKGFNVRMNPPVSSVADTSAPAVATPVPQPGSDKAAAPATSQPSVESAAILKAEKRIEEALQKLKDLEAERPPASGPSQPTPNPTTTPSSTSSSAPASTPTPAP